MASYINFCRCVDLHVEFKSQLKMVVAIAEEHGFRSIVTIPSQIGALTRQTKNNKNIQRTVALDSLLGTSSIAIRQQSVILAHTKGAHSVEIAIPFYSCIDEETENDLETDISRMADLKNKLNMNIKYVFDMSLMNELGDSVKKIASLLRKYRLNDTVIVSDMYDVSKDKINDIVLEHVLVKNKIKSLTLKEPKATIYCQEASPFFKMVKSGTKHFGLMWQPAANIVQEYNGKLNAKKK